MPVKTCSNVIKRKKPKKKRTIVKDNDAGTIIERNQKKRKTIGHNLTVPSCLP